MLWMAQWEAEETPSLTFSQIRTNMVPVFPQTPMKRMQCSSKLSADKENLQGGLPRCEAALGPLSTHGCVEGCREVDQQRAPGQPSEWCRGRPASESCGCAVQVPGWLRSSGEVLGSSKCTCEIFSPRIL